MNQRQIFLANVAQTSPFPMGLEVAAAKGMFLYDPDGKRYLDLIAGIGVSSLGHCHPAVVAAVQRQSETYMHTIVYGEFVLTPQVELAKLLTDQLPDTLDNVYFTNSGTEATEGAMKLAKRFTGRSEFVAATQAYHGSTQGSASLMWPKTFTRAYHPLLPGISHLEFNSFEDLDRITTKTAAVVLETVQAEWGIRKPIPAWLQAVRKRCDEVGALLILDEIQAGYGRTGSLFAFEQYGVVPDILLLAKGMGGGMPIGCFVASKKIMQVFTENPILGNITTFGGHPVSCAAGLATLKSILSEQLLEKLPKKIARFKERLVHPAIREVREAGLWFGVEVGSFEQVQQVIKYCLDNGLITDWFLFNDRTIRIAPPLIISLEEIDLACDILLAGLDTISKR